MSTEDRSERNKADIREFTRMFKNEHNVDGIDHLFDADFVHHFPTPVRPGLAGFKDVGRMMNSAFPDVVATEEDMITERDVVVERSSAVATHQGAVFGVEPTGARIDWTEIHIYGIREGKIVAHWVEWSSARLVSQLQEHAASAAA